MNRFRPIMAASILWFVGLASQVAAHGGEPAISVFPAQAPPGGEVTIFGEDLEPNTAVRLLLLAAEGDVPIGEPTTDGEGHFSHQVTLPEDVTARPYEIRATSTTGETFSAYLTVVEDAVPAGAETETDELGGNLMLAAVLGLGGVALLFFATRPAARRRPG